MPKTTTKTASANTSLQSIEIVNSYLNAHVKLNSPTSSFSFALNVENQIDKAENTVSSLVLIEISSEETNDICGIIAVKCTYFVENLQKSLKGAQEIPAALLEKLNTISISTTRGIMFSTFRGTVLHNALLPIVEANALELMK